MRKVLQCGLVGEIAYIVVTFCPVNDANMGAVFLKFLSDTLANAIGTAGDDDYFVLEHSRALLMKVGDHFFPIFDLIGEIRTLFAISVQCTHSTAMRKCKDMGSAAILQGNRNRVVRAFDECVVVRNGVGKLCVKGRQNTFEG